MPETLKRKPASGSSPAYEPRFPALAATACLSLWIALLSLPMLAGAFVAGPYNDQYQSGFAYRAWAAEWWKRLGHVPLWNPDIFGGMPFLAGMSGDVLYPTAWLRLVLPTSVAMNLGFVIHYLLAGLFMYWFLRRWKVSWTGAVVGGLSYQLAGVIGSYVSPGHDGKLFVTAMLPLLLLGLTLAIRDRRYEGYAYAALATGLMMLSPHPQMAEFALLAAGIFTLFLVFGEGTTTVPQERLVALGLALAAVIVGVGVSAAQYMPFYAYLPYSPRAAAVLHDFSFSASYAIPWMHVPEFLIPRFTGESFNHTYWGPNGVKLHSEYLGLAAVALGVVGAMDRGRRRIVIWLLAIGALFMLIALGSDTPFFRLWWEIVPFAKSTRAPGMALFVVCFVTATMAAMGIDRLARKEAPRFSTIAMIVGGVVALFGLVGVYGVMAQSLGNAVELMGLPGRAAAAEAASATVRWSAFGAGLALVLVGLVTRFAARGTLSVRAASFALIAIVGTDFWLNARVFWHYSDPAALVGSDAIKAQLNALPRPFRVWDATEVYPGSVLMASDISQLYGHHGNEPHAFDLLNDGDVENPFKRMGDPRILSLYAVNYLIVQASAAPESIPGFRRTLSNVQTSSGPAATLFQRNDPISYARFIPSAAQATQDQSVAAVVDARFPVDRVVLLDTLPGATPGTLPNPLPAAVNDPVVFDDWVPGLMHLHLTTPAPAAGYVLVSENWDSDWRATVDGRDTPVTRGDATLITVPVSAGARAIELRYVSAAYERGKTLSFASLLIIVLGAVGPMAIRRRRSS